MLSSIGAWFSAYWYWVAAFAAMAVLIFLLLRLQAGLRDHAAQTIVRLLQTDPALCAERLKHNRKLKLIFRKPILTLWKLDAYMALGEDAKAAETIKALDRMRLEPHDKLEFYQKRLSYYAAAGNYAEAKASRDSLKAFLRQMKADKIAPYAEILSEADLIFGIYIEHNTALIPKLIGRASHTKNDIMRGITQFRIAKLAYFKEDADLMHTYLSRAAKNLHGTWYDAIIEEAMENPSILERK